MRIVHFDIERGWRGGERQVYLLASGLKVRGIDQFVICREGQPLAERLQQSGIAVKPVISRVGLLGHLAGQVLEPTVFHAHTGNTIPFAVMAARVRGARSMVTRRLDLAPTGFFLQRADAVVAISDSVRKSLQNAGITIDHLSVIHSAVLPPPPSDPAPVRKQLRDRLGIAETTPIILAIGALTDQKDPLTAVRTIALLPDAHFVWVGAGSLLQPARQLAEQLRIQHRIHFVGYDLEPNQWFAAADVFFLPSRHEGLGTAYLDAFHHHVPVVGTLIAGTDDVLLDGQTALRRPVGDTHQLATAIQEILQNSDLSHRLIERAAAHAATFNVDAMVESYVQLYAKLCSMPFAR